MHYGLWVNCCLEDSAYELAVTSTRNPVGGGTTPGKTLPGAALQIRSLNGKGLSAQEISDLLTENGYSGYWSYCRRLGLSGNADHKD